MHGFFSCVFAGEVFSSFSLSIITTSKSSLLVKMCILFENIVNTFTNPTLCSSSVQLCGYRYLFPRHFLIPHFWTSHQLVEFQAVYHAHRAKSYRPVIDALMKAAPSITDVNLKICLIELCGKVCMKGL